MSWFAEKKKGLHPHSESVCVQAPWLTTSILGPLHPCERDGPFPAALTEPQQECPRLLVLQQSPLSLLADKAHDTPAHGKGLMEVLWGSVMTVIFKFTYKSRWLQLDTRTQDRNVSTISDALKSISLTLQEAFHSYIYMLKSQKSSLTWCPLDATDDQ